jgi:flavin-dependent dehydrogenase
VTAERASSIIEVAAVRPPGERYDVAILGGGLAGLTLAIQLKEARSDTSVLVLEKREGPAPLAAFKVGESTVPCGAHYFAEVVGMREHLEKEQLIKCGLRFFLSTDDNQDIAERPESGPPDYPPHNNYQVDRGLFENTLARRARALGVDVAQGARVREIDLDADPHEITFEQFGEETSTTARWVVDAAGRASLLKRKLGLATDCGHHINSSWFRLRGGLDIEDWGRQNQDWMGRMREPGIRQFSTNHLMGEGYWMWMIPLSSGPISIGVCADPRVHPFEEINSFDGLLEWMRKHEPQLAASVENRVDDIEDFLRVEDFAYGVKQTYSPQRWSLVGEAGAFADPFYSPGSDFICYGNTFTTDLITRDLNGEDITERIDYYNDLYQRAFAHVISRYQDTYPLFGNQVVGINLLNWDIYANHVGIVLLTVTNKLTDLEFMKSVDDELDRLFKLNINMHKLFLQWNELERRDVPPTTPRKLLFEALEGVAKDYPDDDAIRAALGDELRNSEALAVYTFHQAAQGLPEAPAVDRPVNPYAVGLDPKRWEADGLYDSPGLTLEQAQEIIGPIGPAMGGPVGAGRPAGMTG